ncbi:MAG: ABC transporter ATP-binding protein [Anaerolineae bacterium]
MPFAIETFELTKQFPRNKGLWDFIPGSRPSRTVTAVDNVNLTVGRGELFGLLGPNGAGKTTLIKLLCTLIVPTSGTARVNGYDLQQEEAIKASVGLVSGDERSFYWRLSGRRNLEFFASLHGLPARQRQRRVEDVLELMELREIADERFQTYSTGMRQRLSLARGLLSNPEILFLDEPTKSLDPIATRHLRDFIKDRLVGERGVTVFLTTHRLEEAEQLCQRIAIMDQGRIRACGTISELRRILRKGERYSLRISGLSEALQDELASLVVSLKILPLDAETTLLEFDTLDGEETLSEVIEVIHNNGGRIRAVSSQATPLEEVFAHLTQEEGDQC